MGIPDVITVSDEIQKKIKLLERMRKEVLERGQHKAEAIAEYEKCLTIDIVKLKNMQKGETIDFEGIQIKAPLPITIIEKIAKGMCYKEKLSMEQADASYKSVITNINTVQAELSALQSLNRFLDKA